MALLLVQYLFIGLKTTRYKDLVLRKQNDKIDRSFTKLKNKYLEVIKYLIFTLTHYI